MKLNTNKNTITTIIDINIHQNHKNIFKPKLRTASLWETCKVMWSERSNLVISKSIDTLLKTIGAIILFLMKSTRILKIHTRSSMIDLTQITRNSWLQKRLPWNNKKRKKKKKLRWWLSQNSKFQEESLMIGLVIDLLTICTIME